MGDTANLVQGVTGLVQAGSQLAIGSMQSGAIQSEGAFKKQQFEMNSRFAEMQADDAIKRGQKAYSKQLKGTKILIGAQRASLAAQGIDVGVGSALDIQYDTKKLGEFDALTIKNNAWQEAWGFKMQSLNYKGQGTIESITANNKANNTMLTAGLNASESIFKSLPYFKSSGPKQEDNYVRTSEYVEKRPNFK